MRDYQDYKNYLDYLQRENGSIKEIINTYYALYGENLSYDYRWKKGELIFYISGHAGSSRFSSELLVDIGAYTKENLLSDVAEELCTQVIHPELMQQRIQ